MNANQLKTTSRLVANNIGADIDFFHPFVQAFHVAGKPRIELIAILVSGILPWHIFIFPPKLRITITGLANDLPNHSLLAEVA